VKNILINPNLKQIKESATLNINIKIKAKRKKGEKVSHFGFGESPFPVPELIVNELKSHADKSSYLPGEGLHELKHAIINYYKLKFNYNFNDDDVFVAPGSKESIFHLLKLLQGPLLLPSPSWVSYEPQATILGKDVIKIPTSFENNYFLNAKQLEFICSEYEKTQQKILLLNSPNNPTGLVYPQVIFDELAKVCKENNIIVISDEIYAGVNFSKGAHSSMVYSYPQGTIVTSGLSKYFSAGGYRVGFCMIPDNMQPLKKALNALISETYSCVSEPMQRAAIKAYSEIDYILPELEINNQIHKISGEYLHQRFTSIGLKCHKPQGAFYCFPSFEPFKDVLAKQNIYDDITLCEKILENANVAMLPGSEFGVQATDLCTRVATVDYDGKAAQQFQGNKDLLIKTVMRNLVAGCDSLEKYLNGL